MACRQGQGEETYDFFDDIEDYIKKEKEIQTDDQQFPALGGCISISKYVYKETNPEIVKGICEKFTKLYKTLANFQGDHSTKNINGKDWGFLNYWLNYKIKEIKNNENICIHSFYDNIESYVSDIFQVNLAIGKMYDIKYDDFNNMKNLYFLYKKYITLNNILNPTLNQEETGELSSTNDCFVDYIKARSSCIGKENAYCKKLEKFKSKYQELFSIQGIKKEDFNNNFKKLPDDSNVIEELSIILLEENYHSIVTIPIILSIFGLILLFFLFYKVKENLNS